MDFEQTISYLLSLGHETLTIKLGLENTETLLAALGDPQAQFPAVRAEIVAITPVALDHQEYLGTTLREIAAEKAAIIRPGTIAIIAPQDKTAFEVIIRQCESVEVKPRLIASPLKSPHAPNDEQFYATLSGATTDGRCIVTF